jgi:hypothetical protein
MQRPINTVLIIEILMDLAELWLHEFPFHDFVPLGLELTVVGTNV